VTSRHSPPPAQDRPSLAELVAWLPAGRLWALLVAAWRRLAGLPAVRQGASRHRAPRAGGPHADRIMLDQSRPAVLAARAGAVLAHAATLRGSWPTWTRWLTAGLTEVMLAVWLGWVPVAVLAVAGLGVRVGWGRWDRLEHVLAVAGLTLLVWGLPLTRPETVVAAGTLALAAWWLTASPESDIAEPIDPTVAGLFAAIRRIAAIPPVTTAFRTETDAEYQARGGTGQRRTVPFEAPTNPADHIRLLHAQDEDGTRRLDARGRPVVEAVRVRLPDHFERNQRGDRLQRQLAEYLGTRVLADWSDYNQPIFRRVPDLVARVEHGAARALLPLVSPFELILGRTDADAAFAKELAGQSWFVVDQRRHPNLLIVGRIGMGKSSVGRHVAAMLLAQGAELLIADGKGGEFTQLAGRAGVLAVAHRPHDIVELASYAREELQRRMALVDAAALQGQPRPQFRPLVLVTDEHKMVVDQLDRDQATAYNEDLRYLAVGGRRDRVWSVHMLQRPAAGTSSDVGLPTVVRAQMSVKVGMGPQDKIGAEMIFEDTDLGAEIELLEGRAGVLVGRHFARVQIPWLANPAELEPGTRERAEAERWLPPVTGKPRSRPAHRASTPDQGEPDGATSPGATGDQAEPEAGQAADAADMVVRRERPGSATQATPGGPAAGGTHPVTTRLEPPTVPAPIEPRQAPTTLGDTNGLGEEPRP
jgi:FtsK/SpoIIIE family